MIDYISISSIICILVLLILFIRFLYILVHSYMAKKLSTHIYNFELARKAFEDAARLFELHNPNYYMRISKIECKFGWNFYYEIKRKEFKAEE